MGHGALLLGHRIRPSSRPFASRRPDRSTSVPATSWRATGPSGHPAGPDRRARALHVERDGGDAARPAGRPRLHRPGEGAQAGRALPRLARPVAIGADPPFDRTRPRGCRPESRAPSSPSRPTSAALAGALAQRRRRRRHPRADRGRLGHGAAARTVSRSGSPAARTRRRARRLRRGRDRLPLVARRRAGGIGVTPDLTALAKVVAGGLPGGALGGRADVMDVLGGPPTTRARSSTRARTTRIRCPPPPA